MLAVALVIGLVIFVVMWPLSLWGHALHLTPSWHQLMHRDKRWMHEHYPLVGLRFVAAFALLAFVASFPLRTLFRRQAEHAAELERQRMADHRAWLQAPPAPLPFPGRFTQSWIEANVPTLHPGQVPWLMDELRARGWTDARIAQRVEPYVVHHPS